MGTKFIPGFCIFCLLAGCGKPSGELEAAKALLNTTPVVIAWLEGDMEKSGLDNTLALLLLHDLDGEGPDTNAEKMRVNRGKKVSDALGKKSQCYDQYDWPDDRLERCVVEKGYDKAAKYGACFGYNKFNFGEGGKDSYIVASNGTCEDTLSGNALRRFYILIPDIRGSYHIGYKTNTGTIAVRKNSKHEFFVTEEVSTVGMEMRTIAVFDKTKQKFVPKTCLFRDNSQFREKFGDQYPDNNRLEGVEVVPCPRS